jgi:hypothetical protein
MPGKIEGRLPALAARVGSAEVVKWLKQNGLSRRHFTAQ